jgi:hypothetical protein
VFACLWEREGGKEGEEGGEVEWTTIRGIIEPCDADGEGRGVLHTICACASMCLSRCVLLCDPRGWLAKYFQAGTGGREEEDVGEGGGTKPGPPSQGLQGAGNDGTGGSVGILYVRGLWVRQAKRCAAGYAPRIHKTEGGLGAWLATHRQQGRLKNCTGQAKMSMPVLGGRAWGNLSCVGDFEDGLPDGAGVNVS